MLRIISSGALQTTPVLNGVSISGKPRGTQFRPSAETLPLRVTSSKGIILALTVHLDPGVAAMTLTARSDVTNTNLRKILIFVFIF